VSAQTAKLEESERGPGPYRIHVAAELSGVAPATLRAWERRYGIPSPRRSTTAYRLYSAEDVDLVARMRSLIESGIAPAEASRTVRATDLPGFPEGGGEDVFKLAEARLLAATQRWDGRAIDEELMRLSLLVDATTLYARVLSPLLVEVGRRWEAGVLSIAQEHLLSEKVELTLRAALRTFERSEGPQVVLAAIDGDPHVIGLLGAALRFAGGGARVTVLGATTPPAAIADVVRSMAPAMIGLSATIAPGNAKTLFREYGRACGDTRWVVGGPAAGSLARAVDSGGGALAVGTAGAWGVQMRDWLRGAR
jgi:DNA-binding transcriptional MerR regulator/methylmalonyl-CoA mutase cobalamin-binding subunit